MIKVSVLSHPCHCVENQGENSQYHFPGPPYLQDGVPWICMKVEGVGHLLIEVVSPCMCKLSLWPFLKKYHPERAFTR